MVHPAVFGQWIFTQSLPSLIQYSVCSPEKSFTGMTFLRVLGVFDRVDSYQSGGQTTQNWPQYDGLIQKHSFPGVSQNIRAPKSSGWLVLFTIWMSLILKHPQAVFLQNELLVNWFVQNCTANDSNICALNLLWVGNIYRFSELAVSSSHDFPSPEVVGKPMAVRVFPFNNVWICFYMACTRRWNSWSYMMIHEAWSHFQGILYALGIWISSDDWLYNGLEHDVC